jgi:hypothetical protein
MLRRTHAQFIAMSVIITSHWIENGERDYANWFRSVYLVKRWERWHINGAGVAGIIPSQQGIESHHAAIKRTCVPSTRASTSGVLSGILPRILKYDSENLCPPRCALFCEAPLPPEMLLKAGRLIRTKDNYWKVHSEKGTQRRVHSIYFNSKAQIVEATNVMASPVTKTRATRFAASLDGTVADGITEAEIKIELLSLQRVTIRKNFPVNPSILYRRGQTRASRVFDLSSSARVSLPFALVGFALMCWRLWQYCDCWMLMLRSRSYLLGTRLGGLPLANLPSNQETHRIHTSVWNRW